MSESRSREDRWFAFGINAIDVITAYQTGEQTDYNIVVGRRSFIDTEGVLEPAADREAKIRGIGHVLNHFNFDWKIDL